jgi:hypothetical protein
MKRARWACAGAAAALVWTLAPGVHAQDGTGPGETPARPKQESERATPAPQVQAAVEIRGDAGSAGGEVRAMDASGVTLGDAGGRQFLVGWDRVRATHGLASPPAMAFASVAADVWRARSRLERDDWRAAEPLFEQLFTSYRGLSGPTAAVVDEGLLRCRLKRASQASAVWAWLELVRVQREHDQPAPGAGAPPQWVGGTIALRAVRDEQTSLVAALPPVWLSERSLRVFVESPDWAMYAPGEKTDPVVSELASLYRAAARFELDGKLADPIGPSTLSHPGVALVRDMVLARAGDDKQRAEARKALQKRVDEGSPRWIDVWCRVGIGRSLLMESGDTERALGVVSLLHVPARFGEEYAALAGTALAQAAAGLHAMGDEAGARALVEELRRVYPTHPAASWSGLSWYTPSTDGKLAGGSVSAR